ncbi:M48 family metallopeptidase [Pseudochelatococcus lubricantis]|uniref:M48 family metallopeptidase n=1 Tax=Pseudochelatococcus lubricantis TaxID=1538102 RepID=UPI0035E6D421
MAAFGLYTHIRANRVRSALLIAGLFLLVYVLVFAGALAGEALAANAPFDVLVRRALDGFVTTIPVATLAALAWIGIAYFFHQKILGAITGSHDITRADAPELYALLENLCISRGLRTPRLAVMETDALNAYASGLNEDQYAVTVTRGLLATLNRAEIEAVLAHELTHIRNRDVQLMVTAMIIAGVVSFFGEMLFRWLRFAPMRSSSRDNDRKGGGAALAIVVALVLAVLAWVLSIAIRFSLSRSREYLADAGAVELTKNPDAMISALLKISGHSDVPAAPSAVMEMCIDNPRTGFSSLFATHPPIGDRIDALVRYAGGHLPSEPLPVPGTEPATTDAAPEPGTDAGGPWSRRWRDRWNARRPTDNQPPPRKRGPWG